MTAHNKNVPALRFPEFDGDWESQKIGNSVDLISGFAFRGEDITEDSSGVSLLRGVNITEGKIRHSNETDRFYIGSLDKLEKYFLQVGDLVIGMDGSKVGKNSALITEKDSNSLLIQRVARLRSKNNSSIAFIYQHINSFRFHDYVERVKTSSGIPHISSQQLNDFTIFFPSNEEQQKTAAFLTAVDDKIQQLAKKKDLLEQYKKGVMQKIFNQEVRFKDDNGNHFADWQEKKIGEILLSSRLGGNYTNSEQITENPLIKMGNLDRGFIKLDKLDYIPENEELNEEDKISLGDLFLNTRNTLDLVGKVAIWRNELPAAYYNSNLMCLKFDNNFFMNYRLNSFEGVKALRAIATGTTSVAAIYTKDLLKIKLNIPSLPEQDKIATFLSAIDDKTNLVNQQLEKTQTFKKGLLQQMFI